MPSLGGDGILIAAARRCSTSCMVGRSLGSCCMHSCTKSTISGGPSSGTLQARGPTFRRLCMWHQGTCRSVCQVAGQSPEQMAARRLAGICHTTHKGGQCCEL